MAASAGGTWREILRNLGEISPHAPWWRGPGGDAMAARIGLGDCGREDHRAGSSRGGRLERHAPQSDPSSRCHRKDSGSLTSFRIVARAASRCLCPGEQHGRRPHERARSDRRTRDDRSSGCERHAGPLDRCLVVVESRRATGIVTVSDLLELVGRGLDRGAATTKRRTLSHRVLHRKSKGVVGAW